VERELRKTECEVSEYAQYKTKQLMDPRIQMVLGAGIQALAVFNGTGRFINREIIPRAMGVFDNLSNAAISLDKAIQSKGKFVNVQLLAEARQLLSTTSEAISAAKTTVDAASKQIVQAGCSASSTLTVQRANCRRQRAYGRVIVDIQIATEGAAICLSS
jgi:hypothetical protein